MLREPNARRLAAKMTESVRSTVQALSAEDREKVAARLDRQGIDGAVAAAAVRRIDTSPTTGSAPASRWRLWRIANDLSVEARIVSERAHWEALAAQIESERAHWRRRHRRPGPGNGPGRRRRRPRRIHPRQRGRHPVNGNGRSRNGQPRRRRGRASGRRWRPSHANPTGAPDVTTRGRCAPAAIRPWRRPLRARPPRPSRARRASPAAVEARPVRLRSGGEDRLRAAAARRGARGGGAARVRPPHAGGCPTGHRPPRSGPGNSNRVRNTARRGARPWWSR